MQPQGRSWRRWHNAQIFYGGALYIFGVSGLIACFLAWRGRIPIREGESGQSIERFGVFERANHWFTAVSFVLMALTGLIILYGNALIRPWLGASAYAELASLSAWFHVAFAVPFFIGILLMIVFWIGQNIPERLDWEWLRRGGGFVSDRQENPPARKFNAGQKLVFWGVSLGGLFLTATGVGLMFPFFWSGYTGMQLAQILHAAVGLLLIGLMIGHIYIGTIGMQGAFQAMWSGRVDRNWAKEHHSLWYRRVAQDAQASSPEPRSSPVIAFVSGAAVAVVFALVMVAIYQVASVSNTELATASKPQSVHLQTEAGSAKAK
jgi:formate dehydrogenase subunit gamma